MSLILAVEPDRRQAAHLTQIVRQRVGSELILAETTELALAQIGNRVPDLILVPALLSPTEDAALAAALRVIATAAHVQMVTTPLFASAAPAPKARGVLAAFRPTKTATDGCDPAEFAQQISSYLESAAEERASAQYIEPPLSVSAPAPQQVAESPQRYVPLEPGRLYRDETAAPQNFEIPAASEAVAEPAVALPEFEPIAEITEAVAESVEPVEFETEQLPAYETTYVETIPEAVSMLAEPLPETLEPVLETAEPIFEAQELMLEAPEPVFETSELMLETAEPVLETAEPMLETPAPVLETPEPMFAAPEPMYAAPEPMYAAPEPMYAAPEAIVETPEPVFEAPEPIVETPEPILAAQEPILETPEPVFEMPSPTLAAPEPIFETAPVLEAPAPAFEALDPIVDASEPTLETPEPLAARGPAYSRRIGFVVHDSELEIAPLAESFDLETEQIEMAASFDTDFVVEAISETEPEPVATYSASVDDEAIELVDVDLSSALSEFDELHVVEAQSDSGVSDFGVNDISISDIDMSDVGVAEMLETPANVEAVAPAAPQARVIEFDALKEFAASLEMVSTPEKAVVVVAQATSAKAFEFDDLFPPREPVEPSPLGAWRSWMPLEGMTAEAWDSPVPAHVVDRAVERPAEKRAPERPNWVQLVESLRLDVERRRSEQPAAEPTPPRKAPTRPIQDEWGLFDPAQCGFAALLEKLDEITESNASRPRRSA